MSKRTSRLGLIISLAVALSMALISFAPTIQASAARAGKGYDPATCKKPTVKAKGLIKYSDWQFPDTLNIYQSSLAVTSETTAFMFNGLVYYDRNVKLQPLMATVIPTIKNGGVTGGGKVITFHLRHNLRWSNGAEITSKDINFGWKVDSDPVTGPVCSGSCDVISRIDTPDKYTAVFHLKKIYAPAIPNAIPDIWPTKWAGAWDNDPHAAAEKLAQDQSFNFETPDYPTNGPYQVTQFVNNDRIELKPMARYTIASCGAYIQQLIFAFYSSKPSLIAAAAGRQTDWSTDYTAADLPDLKQHTDAFKTYTVAGFTFEHLELNQDAQYNGQPNPLHTVKVRQALALALDKYGLIQSALGLSRKSASSVIGWVPWVILPGLVQQYANKNINGQWDPLQKKYMASPGTGQALTDAKKLLAQTSFKDGFSLDFFTTSGNPVRQAQEAVIAANWARLNVKVTPNYVPASKLFTDWDHGGITAHGSFQIAMFAFTIAPEPDGLKYIYQSKYIERRKSVHPCPVCSNDSGVTDSVIDKAFDAAAYTFDSKLRAKNYALVQQRLNQNVDLIALYFRPHIETSDGKILGFNPGPTGAQWNSFSWKPKSG